MLPNQTDVHNVLSEFLELAVHNILYQKKLYPDSIFVPKRKYGIVVHQCIHPDVNSYINNCLKAANYHLKKNQLKNFSVLFESDCKLVEKFVFEISSSGNGVESDPYFLELEKHLRNFCLKLHAFNAYPVSLPEDSTFAIEIGTTKLSCLEFNDNHIFEDFPWTYSDEEHFLENPEIAPLQSFSCKSLNMHIYVEFPCSDF